MREKIDYLVNKHLTEAEDLTKGDIDKRIKDALKKEKSSLLKGKDFEDAVVEIVRNSLIDLYKSLWIRRSFWSKDIQNRGS